MCWCVIIIINFFNICVLYKLDGFLIFFLHLSVFFTCFFILLVINIIIIILIVIYTCSVWSNLPLLATFVAGWIFMTIVIVAVSVVFLCASIRKRNCHPLVVQLYLDSITYMHLLTGMHWPCTKVSCCYHWCNNFIDLQWSLHVSFIHSYRLSHMSGTVPWIPFLMDPLYYGSRIS